MALHKDCDNCGKRISDDNPIVAKLYIAPFTSGKTRAVHSLYTGHMDIGYCCSAKVVKGMNWQKRRTRAKANGS
jgi:hypothetical protein